MCAAGTRQVAHSAEQQALQRAWTTFARAVQRHDVVTVKQLSTDCIYTEEAYPRPYVRTAAFLQQWRSVFDTATTARLLQPGCLRFNLDNEQNKALYSQACLANAADFKTAKVQEVVVTTIDPYPASAGEGMQKAFAFIRLRGGYKFCGYSTIP